MCSPSFTDLQFMSPQGRSNPLGPRRMGRHWLHLMATGVTMRAVDQLIVRWLLAPFGEMKFNLGNSATQLRKSFLNSCAPTFLICGNINQTFKDHKWRNPEEIGQIENASKQDVLQGRRRGQIILKTPYGKDWMLLQYYWGKLSCNFLKQNRECRAF